MLWGWCQKGVLQQALGDSDAGWTLRTIDLKVVICIALWSFAGNYICNKHLRRLGAFSLNSLAFSIIHFLLIHENL
jgi:hypothetical protein